MTWPLGMDDGDVSMIAIGPCCVCRQPFSFDPDRVPSIALDPETGLTPELGGDPERAVKVPVCPGCLAGANRVRARLGQEPIRLHPEAGYLA